METHPRAALVLVTRALAPLVVTRRDSPLLGLPGGKVEPGEDPRVAAARELREETGVVVDPGSLRELYRGRDGDRVVVTYLAPDQGGEPAPQPGEGRASWGSWDALTGPHGAFPAYNAAVRAAWELRIVPVAAPGRAPLPLSSLQQIAEPGRPAGFYAVRSWPSYTAHFLSPDFQEASRLLEKRNAPLVAQGQEYLRAHTAARRAAEEVSLDHLRSLPAAEFHRHFLPAAKARAEKVDATRDAEEAAASIISGRASQWLREIRLSRAGTNEAARDFIMDSLAAGAPEDVVEERLRDLYHVDSRPPPPPPRPRPPPSYLPPMPRRSGPPPRRVDVEAARKETRAQADFLRSRAEELERQAALATRAEIDALAAEIREARALEQRVWELEARC